MHDGTIRPDGQEPETGLIKFGERFGVYIRNADAIVFGKDLDKALIYLERNAPQTVRAKVLELRLLLGLVTK